MGLFGFLKKAAGKIIKGGLSIATHGASDKVIKAIKSTVGSKSPQQQVALVEKLTPPIPKVSRTEQYTEGWGVSPGAYGGNGGSKRMGGKAYKRRATGNGGMGLGSWSTEDLLNTIVIRDGKPYDSEDRRMAAELRRRGVDPLSGFTGAGTTTRAAKRARKPAGARAGAKRTLTPAMRAMAEKSKRLAAQWRGLGGQAGTGQTFFEWKRGK